MTHTYEIKSGYTYKITSDKILTKSEALELCQTAQKEFVGVDAEVRRALPRDFCGKLFPRYCSVTHEGMHEGWLVDDCNPIKYAADAVAACRAMGYEGSDEEILEEACEDETCFWTQWELDDIDCDDSTGYRVCE